MQIGDVLGGKYRIGRLIGDGGMGTVYEAEHVLLGVRVALKVLHSDLARRPGLGERFLQEARVAAQIRSPYVVQVTDVDKTPDGTAYLVMELLTGEPLSSLIERDHTLPLATACEFTLQMLHALEAAHALGVIHRDLKPENVFVTSAAARIIKLIDFGIAKLRSPGTKNMTAAGVLMGTAEYMAPEQVHAASDVDGRSDLYSVGVLLYEMLAGRRPVAGENAVVIALKVERGDVIPLAHVAPHVPPDIVALVHRAMASKPAQRFASATEMRLALERARDAAATARPERSGGPAVHAPHTAHGGPPVLEGLGGASLGSGGIGTPLVGTGTEMGAPLPADVRAAIAGAGVGAYGPNGYGTGAVPASPGLASLPVDLGSTVPVGGTGYGGYNAYGPPAGPTAAPGTGPLNGPVNGYGSGPGQGAGNAYANAPALGVAIPYGPPQAGPAPMRRPQKKFPWWALVTAVVVGAGVGGIVLYNYYAEDDTSPPRPPPVTPPPIAPLSTPPTPPTVTTAPLATAPLAPLAPPRGGGGFVPRPTPHPTPSASGSAAPLPSAQQPSGIPTLTIPTSFPFPSAFPNPFEPPAPSQPPAPAAPDSPQNDPR